MILGFFDFFCIFFRSRYHAGFWKTCGISVVYYGYISSLCQGTFRTRWSNFWRFFIKILKNFHQTFWGFYDQNFVDFPSNFWRFLVKILKNFHQLFPRCLMKFGNIFHQTFWEFFMIKILKIFHENFEDFSSKVWRIFIKNFEDFMVKLFKIFHQHFSSKFWENFRRNFSTTL